MNGCRTVSFGYVIGLERGPLCLSRMIWRRNVSGTFLRENVTLISDVSLLSVRATDMTHLIQLGYVSVATFCF